MATYYRWRKSTIVYVEKTRSQSGNVILNGNTIYYTKYGDAKPTLNTVNGKYTLPYSKTYTADDFAYWDECYFGPTETTTAIYYNKGRASLSLTGTSRITLSCAEGFDIYYSGQGPGTSQGYVYSTSSSAYPNGGVQDGYYYDQRTTVESPTAPTNLTYPATITTPTVEISWTAATSNTSYPVDHYSLTCDPDGGVNYNTVIAENIPAGTTSYTYTIPAGTTSIAFAVRAFDSNGAASSPTFGPASTVLLSPTLTVPQMVMQGQQATISWSAIDGADSYTLQRKSSADADWTQVYSGADLSYTETVGTWTSLQYRVQAVFDGTPGGWAESAAIPVVSSSALVISGQDGDLGTVVNDIPYSISTDTGNQITATITVNSAVIFSGNVGNSTSDTIPVLDLVNGTGTIVIEASVTASGGPVSAVRTWTYTKTPITFPNAGSVAQLTKEGENIFPKTLAECVRLPGGKTLDEVTAFPCQVYTGSYVGTGTSGQNNPTTLTFPFEPKILFVSKQDQNLNSVGFFMLACKGVTNAQCMHAAQNTAPQGPFCALNWSENSVSWYNTSGSTEQLNMNNETYFYVAIG